MAWIQEQVRECGVEVTVLPPMLTRQGPARTRNRALAVATGTLVGCLDSDDTWVPETMALLVEEITSREVGWVAGAVTFVDPDGNGLGIEGPLDFPHGPVPADAYRAHAYRHGFLPFSTCGTLVARTLLEGVGGWDESATYVRAEDIATWARVTRNSPGWFTHEFALRYRWHEASLTHSADWVRSRALDGVDLSDEALDAARPSCGDFLTDLHRANERHLAAKQTAA